MPAGGADIASAQVSLPRTELLDQSHLDNVCTRVQLAAHACPPNSVYGHARALTPLLEAPLEGPVYLGTGYGHKLPDLVADLGGQIEVLLHGKVDTDPEGGLRNSFEVVPDAPVSEFVLSLQGGKKGLLQNSTNICTHPQKAERRLQRPKRQERRTRPAACRSAARPSATTTAPTGAGRVGRPSVAGPEREEAIDPAGTSSKGGPSCVRPGTSPSYLVRALDNPVAAAILCPRTGCASTETSTGPGTRVLPLRPEGREDGRSGQGGESVESSDARGAVLGKRRPRCPLLGLRRRCPPRPVPTRERRACGLGRPRPPPDRQPRHAGPPGQQVRFRT